MRLFIDSMILVMVLAILVAAVSSRHARQAHERDLVTLHEGLVQFDDQLAFRGAIWQSEHEDAGAYPPQVMPDWFRYGLPGNPLVSGDRPWVDIAPANDNNQHPPDPLAEGPGQAAFWYNPNLGIIRARVPRQVSDRLTLDLYNTANHTNLPALHDDRDPDRVPLAFNPNPVTVGLLASPDPRTVGVVQTREPDAKRESGATGPTGPEQATPWWEDRTEPSEPAGAPAPVVGQTPETQRPSLRVD
jgi:hypothetical protein